MPRRARLTNQEDFKRVFAHGERHTDWLFTMLCHANGLDYARLGLAISRKAAAKASARNRLKRLSRESFRLHARSLAGLDIVVMARAAATAHDNPALSDSLDAHYRTMSSRCTVS